MAQILLGDIEDDLKERLQRRAARHGRSMQAEVRDILRNALKGEVQPTGELGTEIAALFKGIGLRADEEIRELRGYFRARGPGRRARINRTLRNAAGLP